jgi:hypothetical protein
MTARDPSDNDGVERFRLATPSLDFWVDVTLLTRHGRWVAVASLAGEPKIGLGNSRANAVREALKTLGVQASESLIESLSGADHAGEPTLVREEHLRNK